MRQVRLPGPVTIAPWVLAVALLSACTVSGSASTAASALATPQLASIAPVTAASPTGAASSGETAPPVPTPLPPSPTPSPYAYAPPLSGSVNVADKAANDIPGTLVTPTATVTSVLDKALKPRDVLAVHLSAGQVLHLGLDEDTDYGSVSLAVANPGTASFDSSSGEPAGQLLCDRCVGGTHTLDYAAAVDGYYYVAVWTTTTATRYQLALSVTQ